MRICYGRVVGPSTGPLRPLWVVRLGESAGAYGTLSPEGLSRKFQGCKGRRKKAPVLSRTSCWFFGSRLLCPSKGDVTYSTVAPATAQLKTSGARVTAIRATRRPFGEGANPESDWGAWTSAAESRHSSRWGRAAAGAGGVPGAVALIVTGPPRGSLLRRRRDVLGDDVV